MAEGSGGRLARSWEHGLHATWVGSALFPMTLGVVELHDDGMQLHENIFLSQPIRDIYNKPLSI